MAWNSKQNWQHYFVGDVLRNGVPSSCLFHGMVRNRIPSISLYFYSTERNSERLLLVLFLGTEFRAFFSSAEQFGTEFREFFVPRNSRNSAGTNKLFRLFRLPRNNFFVGNCQPYLCIIRGRQGGNLSKEEKDNYLFRPFNFPRDSL